MYARIFDQILDSSIAEDCNVRHIFMDLLIIADPTGVVDKTLESIQRRLHVPMEMLTSALTKLMEPDPSSRTPDLDGRRLVLLDPDHRKWGWRIVNHAQYAGIKDEAARRARWKVYSQKHRDKVKAVQGGVSADVSARQRKSAHIDTDVDANKEKKEIIPTPIDPQAPDGQPGLLIDIGAEPKQTPPKPDDFDLWWKHVRNKEEKIAARRAWGKIKNRPPLDEMIDALERYYKTPKVLEGYVKLPANWLNKGCWMDEPDTTPVAAPKSKNVDPDKTLTELNALNHAKYESGEYHGH